MNGDDLRHRARRDAGAPIGRVGEPGTAGDAPGAVVAAKVAARVPAEYREAYLEGFAHVRADRDETAA